MKILAIDLSGTESVRSNPVKYGGVGRTFYSLSRNVKDFYVAGNKELSDVENDKFIPLTRGDLMNIRMGAPVESYTKDFEFDMVLHTFSDVHVNATKPQTVWIVGQNETVKTENTRLLLHNKATQNPITNGFHKISEFTLGLEIPLYEEYEKEDIIFQCTNHYPQIGSVELASLCNLHGIKCYFAGPISDGYNLKSYTNETNIFYLGEIKEEEKIEYLKKAKLFGGLYSHPINSLPLSFKQALSYNCGILSTPIGYIPHVVKQGVNGFLIQNEEDFRQAWLKRNDIKQLTCWLSVKDRYSEEAMATTFVQAMEELK